MAAADRPSAQLTIRPADADPQQAGHQIALAAAGETTIELELESAAGETARVYWVVLRRSAAAPEAPSSGLNALRFSGLPALEFSEQESRYELDAPEALEETTVIVSRAESEAGVDIFTVRGDELVVDEADHDPNAPGHQTLLSEWGDTLLLVRVTSGDGRSQRAYVTRLRGEPNTPPATPGLRSGTRSAPKKPASSGARDDDVPTLSALSLSGASLTPAFAADVFEYQANAAADVEQVTITATPSASDGTLTVIPADADALQTGHQVSLGAAGTETVIAVIVSNAARSAQQLSDHRPARTARQTPTTLQSLVVEGHELSPAFAADVPLYQVDVGANVSDVTLTALPTAATATLTFVPADADPATPGYQVALGSPGAQTTTSIAIILSAPGAAAHTTYVVIITRAAPDPSDAALSSLSVDGHTLTPAFDPETSDYALTVPADSDSVTIRAVSSSPSASLSVSPPDADPLEPGHQIPLAAVEPGQPPSLTTATVTVTSADLSATRTYTITITVARKSPIFVPITMELPSGCTLREIADGPIEGGEWTTSCGSVNKEQGSSEPGYSSYSTYYRLVQLEHGWVTIRLLTESSVIQGQANNLVVVLRSARGISLAKRYELWNDHFHVQGPLGKTLKPGNYVIELVNYCRTDCTRDWHYTLRVAGARSLRPSTPLLANLQLSDVNLPPFSDQQLLYSVDRPAGVVAATTVTATPQAPVTDGDVTILPLDADPITPGHQVKLPIDRKTVISVQVADPAGLASPVTYTVTVPHDAEAAPTGCLRPTPQTASN